jgi:hypothetical protein
VGYESCPTLTPTLKLALTPERGQGIRPLVAMGHKITNVLLILKIWEIIFCFWENYFMGHFSGYFEGASTFLTPQNIPRYGP